MEKFFKLKENGTTVRTEFFAALTTFFAMVYILIVNANMFANPFGDGTNVLGVSYGAIYIATAISAVVGTILVGLLANLPLAMASGMGLNAFFVYTMCVGFGFSYANALVLVIIDGIVFIILTITGLRQMILHAIPKTVRKAIPAGIGLFIAFLGLQNAGIVIADSSTGVTLGSFNLLNLTWGDIMPMVVTLLAFFAIAILAKKNVRGSVFIGMLIGMALYYLLGVTIPGFYENLNISVSSPFAAFSDFGTQAFAKVFTEGFDFSAYSAAHGSANLILVIVTSSLAFMLVDMFDTLGTLHGACSRGGLVDENGEVLNLNKAMLSDAIATTTGAICGTSTVTTFVESTSGIAEGGRTGLTSVFAGLFFLIAMFLSPIAQLIPGCATAAALIYVGVLMMQSIGEIEWGKLDVAVPAFMTIAFMPFTYNISYGIAFGMFGFVAISAFTGKFKDVKIATWIIAILFILMLLLTH